MRSSKPYDMDYNEIEKFCKEHHFLFHEHGSGKWGADRYWTYYKVKGNEDTVFSIEYFPVRHMLKIRSGTGRYEGSLESLHHMMELLGAMRIKVEDIC